MPVARADGLVVEEFGDELLMYDLSLHHAHCLNPTAAFIWRRCDGRTAIAAVVAEVGEAAVWMAIERLATAGLLTQPVIAPASEAWVSRRDVMRVAGVSLLVPLVESIVAPRAAEAASSVTEQICQDTCSGINLPCSDQPGTKCKNFGSGGNNDCQCA
jgi:hypothetical protein